MKKCKTAEYKIYLAGPIEVAKQYLREEFKCKGGCATITPTDYIYSFGEETGYVVGLINYARFPEEDLSKLYDRAIRMAYELMERTCQRSATVVTPIETCYLTREDER